MKLFVYTSPNGSWEIAPTNALAGFALVLVIAHFFFRVYRWLCAMHDVYSRARRGWVFFPWRSKRKPGTIPLNKPTFHLVLSGVLFVAYVMFGEYVGWIAFIRQ